MVSLHGKGPSPDPRPRQPHVALPQARVPRSATCILQAPAYSPTQEKSPSPPVTCAGDGARAKPCGPRAWLAARPLGLTQDRWAGHRVHPANAHSQLISTPQRLNCWQDHRELLSPKRSSAA